MEIKKICVIGAGAMGSGIAQLVATYGYNVNLVDLTEEIVTNAKNSIKKNLERHYVARDKISIEEATKFLDSINIFTDQEDAIQDVDLVIEAVFEDMNVKKQIFETLDKVCPSNTILASNTSSLPITAIGAVTNRADKVIGMHFMNPVPMMKLVEIIRGIATSD